MELFRYERRMFEEDFFLAKIWLKRMIVIRETPCGYWARSEQWAKEQWISKTSRKGMPILR